LEVKITIDRKGNENKLQIQVSNKGFLKKDVIGVYEFKLSYNYCMKDHAMLD
jgi:hypothetical protein